MLSLGSRETEVVEWGGGERFLVLVHGASMTPHMFDQFAERFSDRYHVVAYARRGHGKATVVSEPFDLEDITDDLRVVMDLLEIRHAVLIGHSFGGNEITHMAAEHADRVDGLVYLDADFGGPGRDALTRALASVPLPPCVEKSTQSLVLYRQCLAGYIMAPYEWSASLEELMLDGLADTTSPVVYKTAAEYMGTSLDGINETYSREYDRIHVPALFLMSDTYFPVQTEDTAWNRRFLEWHGTSGYATARDANAQWLREAMPRAQVHIVSGSSHDSFALSEETVAEVERFLETVYQ
jgi:pimeloyl-ACP methyl ester carboxylesterase